MKRQPGPRSRSGWRRPGFVQRLLRSRLGLMGHYYSGMLDIMTDVTLISIAFGTHVESLEVDELSALCAERSARLTSIAAWRVLKRPSMCSRTARR